MTRGGRNLTILGISALLFTGIATGVSLTIYRVSGDIYLDRSRPGYLPDEDEVTAESAESSNYTYPDSGPIDQAGLKEYLEELKAVIDRLDDFSEPFAPGPLSDESLGITGNDAANTDDIDAGTAEDV